MRCLFFILFLSALSISHAQQKTTLEEGFMSPPDSIRTGTFWYWISDNISKEGAIADLHAMKKAGINLAFIGNIGPSYHSSSNHPYGKVKFMSEEWWQVMHAALKTATELDIEIGIFNSPGWSQSGGPWVKPEQSMRYLASSELVVRGPKKISEKIPAPAHDFQDVKVLAFKARRDNLFDRGSVSFSSNIKGFVDYQYALPAGAESHITLTLPQAETVRGILIHPAYYLHTQCLLQVRDGNEYKTIKEFPASRDATIDPQRGFDQLAPIVESLPETTASQFRLVFKNTKENSIISSITLTTAPVVHRYPAKTFAKPENSTAAPASFPDPSLFVAPEQVSDISAHLAADGTLNWDVPEGDWVILRTGMTPTGVKNSPAPPQATGLETDKLSKEHIHAHFDAFLGEIHKRIPEADRKCWKYTVLDSYEKGGQNITDNFLELFKLHYGYDPTPFLPTYYGYPVGSYEISDRFLWDMRRFVADRIACEYVAGLREKSHQYGLKTWIENYGHGGFSAEFLQYGGQSDEVSGEFWNSRHIAEKRAAASCAHIYNKPRVWAEAFTNDGRNGSAYQRHPGMLKKLGDQAFTEGINCMLLHVFIQQYADDTYPGVDGWFGTEFNRKNTYYHQIDLFVDYLKSASYLLQQGLNVADVAYYIGENTPIMTGRMNPGLPKGYDFDFINSEVLINHLEVAPDGRLVLPHGTSYRVLVLPSYSSMLPEVLRKIEKLIVAGATIVGTPPVKSPSLKNYPQADKEVQQLASKIWSSPGVHKNVSLEEVFGTLNVVPDCLIDNDKIMYTHRHLPDGTDIYFLSNQNESTIRINAQFRVSGMQPELWDAVSRTIRTLPVFSQNGNTTSVPLQLESQESVFIVFRNPAKIAASGKQTNFPEPQLILNVDTPWKVNFESDAIKRGPSETVTFSQLSDWTKHEDTRIKYFSGTANYKTMVNLKSIPNAKVYLDLGEVSVMAKVKINGKDSGGVWTAPYRVDITDAVRIGKNTIEVEVVNTWLNRIIGDRKLSENERILTPNTVPWKDSTPLQKSGLLGPVRIVTKD